MINETKRDRQPGNRQPDRALSDLAGSNILVRQLGQPGERELRHRTSKDLLAGKLDRLFRIKAGQTSRFRDLRGKVSQP